VIKSRTSLLDWLILSELVPLFVIMAVVFTTIILVVTSANLVNYLSQGVPLRIVAELIWFNIMPWLVTTFPMAMLLSSVIAFVRLSTQSEIVALFAAGIPFRRLLIPVIGFSLIVTGLALFTNDTISPYAAREFNDLKASAFHELNATTKPFDIPPVREHDKLSLLVHVEGGYDVARQSMLDVYISQIDPNTGNAIALVHARAAKWQGGNNWELEDGTVLMNGMYGKYGPATIDIEQQPDMVAALANNPDTSNFRQLYIQIERLKRSEGTDDTKIRVKDEVALWDKVSLPIACLVFAIIGAPLGLRPQRSAALGIAITVGLAIIFAYYTLYQFMQVLGASGHVDPIVAAFLPDLLGLAVGFILITRSSS
jgi:lipopolysaccharide export system permease protein